MKLEKINKALDILNNTDNIFQITSVIGGTIEIRVPGSDVYHLPIDQIKLKESLIDFLEKQKLQKKTR